MSETSPSETANIFWDIVTGLAAKDEYIKKNIEWLYINDLHSLPIADDYYEDMKQYLTQNYGLTDGLYDQVFDQCEDNFLADMASHGQA